MKEGAKEAASSRRQKVGNVEPSEMKKHEVRLSSFTHAGKGDKQKKRERKKMHARTP